jgi:ATPase subunit of ABC transporter with duplicated ATPase domains
LDGFRELDPLHEGVAPIDFESAGRKLHEISARYDEPFRLAIVGEFKAGKSTLVNALVGRRGVVREGATPVTGVMTELWWGEEERGEVWDGNRQCLFSGSLAEASAYADQRTEEGRKIRGRGARVILRAPELFLRNLVVLDTPAWAQTRWTTR